MNSEMVVYCLIYVCGVLIASISQILLKKSAGKKYDVWWKEYINPRVILAYSMFFVSTLVGVFAYRYVPISLGQVLESTGYIFISVLGYLFLKEKIGKRKLIGLCVIVIGVLIYNIG